MPMAMAPSPELVDAPPLREDQLDAPRSSLRLAALVRDIGAEAQNLEQLLAEVERIAALNDPSVRLAEAQTWVEVTGPLVADDIQSIESRLFAIKELFGIHPELHNRAGDQALRIENAWRRAAIARAMDAPTTQDEVTALVGAASTGRQSLAKIVFYAALLTIPPRLNEHLRGLRPGATLDFHRNFSDELPDPADRERLLVYLSDHPLSVAGVVDPKAGLIFKTSSNRLRRTWSFLGIGLLVAAGAALVFAFTHVTPWFDREDWPVPPTRTSELLVTYLLVFIGAFAHLLIDAIKQSRKGAAQAMALGDMIVWVHVREIQIGIAVISLWIGVFGLALSSDDIGWALAFFVGYSIDSVVDIFLARFEVLAGERTSSSAFNNALAGTASSK